MLIGAHESVAGGLERAFGLAAEDGCEAIQVFTKNANQWREPALTSEQCEAFRKARKSSSLAAAPILSHDSYLINLCTADQDLKIRSRESLLAEALRCEALGIEYVVLHPGAHMGAGVDAGVEAAAEILTWVLDQTRGAQVALLIENTAGQGSSIGSRFEEVAAIVAGVEKAAGSAGKARIGVCLDTCHAFAAGYDLSNEHGFDLAWKQFDDVIGLERLKAMHLNDSKKGLGCRVDRHERIGLGELGTYAFWRLVNDPALAHVVGVLETPPVEKDRAYKPQLLQLAGLRGAPAPAVRPASTAAPTATSSAKPAPKAAGRSSGKAAGKSAQNLVATSRPKPRAGR
ncbi:MAG: deoxyribonuclease IV [Deltaproteobacteria bacterium]|nr:deoxyribonuclease IV [Deltaproteobacteria bacterium]